MEEKIIIAGFGGQGIMFLGKLICQVGMEEKYNVTYIPSYGAEVRGGTANCNVVLSDKAIASPVVDMASTLIVMNELSFLKYEKQILPGGLLLYNSSLIHVKPNRKDVLIESVSASNIAYDLGNIRVANIVMLGRYMAIKKILKKEDVIKNITGPLKDLNIKAFDAGFNCASEKAAIRK